MKLSPTKLRFRFPILPSAYRDELHVLYHRHQIIIRDRFLRIAQRDDAAVNLVELEAGEGVADGLAAVLDRMAAGMLAEHQRRLRHAHVGGTHDLVRAPIFEHAVLMNPRFVREGVASDDGFVRLYVLAGE